MNGNTEILSAALRAIAGAGAMFEPSQPEYDSTTDAENHGDACARFELAEIARKGLREAGLMDCPQAAEVARGGPEAASLFLEELLDSVETLGGIAEEHGSRTLADLMYLQNSIANDSFIDAYPGESHVLDLVSALPSGTRWTSFIKIEYLASPVGDPDLAAVAEWVGLHYRVNFDAEPAERKADWVRRYNESHVE